MLAQSLIANTCGTRRNASAQCQASAVECILVLPLRTLQAKKLGHKLVPLMLACAPALVLGLVLTLVHHKAEDFRLVRLPLRRLIAPSRPICGFVLLFVASGPSEARLDGCRNRPICLMSVSYTHLTLPTKA